jgi:N-acetyl-1-D-myo-inositol-2-amino-2-deoxy-alpha-D-glucopyranoside deacetylase
VNPLAGARRVLFLHAHPDDESLATGALIAELGDQGVTVGVVTATRGERGGVTDAAVLAGGELAAWRERELAGALAVLGVAVYGFLGEPPARAAGLPPRRYTDSGMVWVTPDLAGPVADAGPQALSLADAGEAAADLVAYAEWFGAEVLVSYDLLGGYGHPDHVACHHIARRAAAAAGIKFVELISPTRDAATGELCWAGRGTPGACALELSQQVGRVCRALACYRSQVSVEGDVVVHVGGQRTAVPAEVALRVADLPAVGS